MLGQRSIEKLRPRREQRLVRRRGSIMPQNVSSKSNGPEIDNCPWDVDRSQPAATRTRSICYVSMAMLSKRMDSRVRTETLRNGRTGPPSEVEAPLRWKTRICEDVVEFPDWNCGLETGETRSWAGFYEKSTPKRACFVPIESGFDSGRD